MSAPAPDYEPSAEAVEAAALVAHEFMYHCVDCMDDREAKAEGIPFDSHETWNVDLARAALAAAYPHMVADAVADALDALAADIYNGPPDPAFPQRQSFYNEGVSSWLSEQARIARA